MRKWLARLRRVASGLRQLTSHPASTTWARRLGLVAVLACVTTAAFFWGRSGGTQAGAQQAPPKLLPQGLASATPTHDYEKRVVAYLYDNSVPITRAELGEYLIARFGAERVEFLVNRRIVELECQKRGVYVSDAEVKAALEQDLMGIGAHVTVKDFEQQILKKFNKTLYEWKEDVIRPKLLLAKLARPQVIVTAQELANAFEARHGSKVQCRWIVLAKDNPHWQKVWERANSGEEAFHQEARQQFLPALASQAGVTPPIHRHYPDPQIEKEAFSLKEGQVSIVLGLKDGSKLILKCDKHLPPDKSKSFENEKTKLEKELLDVKLAQKIPEVFAKLKQDARPTIILSPKVHQEELERATLKELGLQSGPGK